MAGFRDVKAKDWFAPAVEYVTERGLMNGRSSTVFAPNADITRAEFAQLLYNMEGRPSGGSAAFADVPKSEWYYDAVAWASSHDIVTGRSSAAFDPDTSIARQEMALMLYRYAKYKELDVGAGGSLSAFKDAGMVADWALDAVSWAVGSKVINGVSSDTLSPTGTATRAQAATMLQNFCTRIGAGGAPSGGGITVSVSEVNSWDQNGAVFRQYNVTVTNNSDSPCDSWAVDLKFDGPITLSNGWNGTCTVNGSALHIASVDYNGALEPGASTDVGFIVSGGAYIQSFAA